jgi:hypothetical protein
MMHVVDIYGMMMVILVIELIMMKVVMMMMIVLIRLSTPLDGFRSIIYGD